MVAFRKLFPVLAIVALLLGTAVMANAQGTPLACNANAGVPPVVRAEGFTELTGDLVITCTGGNPAQPFLANFQLFLNTNITSRIVAGSDVTEALLMVGEPGAGATPVCVSPAPANNTNTTTGIGGLTGVAPAGTGCAGLNQYNVFRGQRGGQPNQTVGGVVVGNENLVVWQGVPVVPPGSNSLTFRITNVRANAAGLGASQTLIPTQIVAYISVFPQGTLPINNPQQTVGYVQRGLVFSVTDCTGTGTVDTPQGQNQCQSQNGDWFSDPTRSSAFASQFGLTFTEGFQTAFKPRIVTGQQVSVPGVVYNSESGFVRTETGTAGVADSGTRLAARFVNVPAGIRIFVSTASTRSFNAGTTDTPNTQPVAVLVTTDPTGATNLLGLGTAASLINPVFGPTGLTCGGTSYAAIEVPITSGSGLAVWEVQNSNPTAIDSVTFLAGWAYSSNVSAGQPALGTGQVLGQFAPFFPAGGIAERMASGLVIPRFVQTTTATNVLRVNQCSTNLLFPYVTTAFNFDTGIAIANTSQDPFSSPNNRLNAGTCTINYYGKQTNGNAPTVATETTDRAIAAGETLAFTLSTGGVMSLKGNQNFTGYIIAQCNFLYAHGFAFITDGPIGQARVAQGYLALVLDGADAGRLRGGTRAEVRGN